MIDMLSDIINKLELKYQKAREEYKLANEIVAKAYIEGYLNALGFCIKLLEKYDKDDKAIKNS